jgi:hypothetical protein
MSEIPLTGNEFKIESIRQSYAILLSQNYERLWSLICSGQTIIGVLDVVEHGYKDEKYLVERCVQIKKTQDGFLAIVSTGVGYSGGRETYEEFLELCKLYNLSFIDNNMLKSEIGEIITEEKKCNKNDRLFLDELKAKCEWDNPPPYFRGVLLCYLDDGSLAFKIPQSLFESNLRKLASLESSSVEKTELLMRRAKLQHGQLRD